MRVEAREVEAALEEEDGVKEAAVVLRDRGRGRGMERKVEIGSSGSDERRCGVR